jgi:hypothetical protein
MNLKILLASATLASALAAGAAIAQQTLPGPAGGTSSETSPSTGAAAAPDASAPADSSAAPATDATASSAMTPAAESASANATPAGATVTTTMTTNGPVADTPENRAKYKPLSRAGQRTAAKGN